ncbi:hypothetical protein BH11ACT4_BH11ACT4_18120 [soil metagenome]
MPDTADLVFALGERAKLEGYPLAGVRLLVADSADDVRRSWSTLPKGVAAVILTPSAAEALGDEANAVAGPMTVVLPHE